MSQKRLQPPPLPATANRPFPGRVVVFAPHADDDVIGCGGALALHHRQGDPVQVVVVTAGLSGDPDGYVPREELMEVREREARAAGAVLGIEDYRFWRYPDGFEVTEDDVEALAENVRRHLLETRAQVVYYPWEKESHSDHWVGSLVVRRALARLPFQVRALGYEVWTACIPTWILDISDVHELKVRAMQQHVSQLRYTDHVAKTMGLNAHRSIFLEPSATHGEAYVLSTEGGG